MLTPELVQAVLDALPAPVFVKDRAGAYLGCNRAFSELLGKTPEQLVGMTVFDLSPGDLAQVYFNADDALMRAGGEQRYETQVQLPNGERRDMMFYKAPMYDAQGEVTGLVGTMLDITERKRLELKLADLAEQDPLTGLFNRRAILARLEMALLAGGPEPSVCLIVCDVDHFKSINDRFGHAAGDEVLRATSQVMQATLRDGDQIGRIGGEEFVVVLRNLSLENARLVAERLRSAVERQTVCVDGQAIKATMSVGVAENQPLQSDWRDLFKRADDCLYQAKHQGRNRVFCEQNTA